MAIMAISLNRLCILISIMFFIKYIVNCIKEIHNGLNRLNR